MNYNSSYNSGGYGSGGYGSGSYGQNSPNYYQSASAPAVYAAQTVPAKQPSHGSSAAGLVLGMLSCTIPTVFTPLAFILGVIGIILSAVAKKNGNTESATSAGLTLCIISTIISGLLILAAFIFIGGIEEIIFWLEHEL